MKAGFYQFDPVFGEKEGNLARVADALLTVECGLMVLPELFATGYQFAASNEVAQLSEEVPEGPTTKALMELSRKRDMFIVGGVAERDGSHFYNSAVLTGPGGFIGVYRKTHLFYEEKLWFTPGNTGFSVFPTDAGMIGIMICFDWLFPESMRVLALEGAEVIAHPANLVLPYCPNAMPVRCLENRVYAVTANRVGTESRKDGQALTYIGTSQVAAPDSTIVMRAPEKGESLMVSEIDLEMARNKSINPFNDLFLDRRPDMYGVVSKPRRIQE
jgi:5-aminopentanamidase